MSDNLSESNQGAANSTPMTPQEVAAMVKNYQDKMTPDDDTQSAWFSVQEIMALINDNNASGVRIHYGRYDDDHAEYPGRHNVILLATHDSDNPDNPTCETSKDLLNNDDNDEDSPFCGRGLNHAALCPPRCTPGG